MFAGNNVCCVIDALNTLITLNTLHLKYAVLDSPLGILHGICH